MNTPIIKQQLEIPKALREKIRLNSLVPISLSIFTAAYLVYVSVIFNLGGLFGGARIEKGVLLLSDMLAYKTHVTLNLRRDELTVAVEGERMATYKNTNLPSWIQGDAQAFEVSLKEGYFVRYEDRKIYYFLPNYGEIVITPEKNQVYIEYPNLTKPEGVRESLVKFDARPAFDHRVQVSRAKIEIHYYEYGWEDFWFPFNSQFNGMGIIELLEISTSSERINPNRKNISVIFDDFWNHPTWQHGILAVAVLETILMAFLGTLTATLIGLPLAFAAANNINSVGFIRFGIKRIFDFVRGIDYLIWSLIFIRSFGLGPLTGALAIAFTDTGTLGKLFSEALENIDSRQKEGSQSTGSDSIQQLRFGVIPQILPVLTSQILYYFESNVRSATVIGALGAGGIGLVLVETMRTQRDWENVLYIIIVTLTIVILIDSLSSRIRRKLIQG